MYSVKAIASLTGLGPETLRAWERRYQAIMPRRNDSGRRFYSQQDLERLMILANLTRQGHAISKISSMHQDQLEKLLNNSTEKLDINSAFTEQIIEALLDYRIDRCEQLLKKALMSNETLPFLREILIPSLQQVGQLWQQGALNVAQEHIFSSCVKRILLGMVNTLHSFSSNRPSILFATPSGEPHEFGILMCCLLAAEHHFNCYYLGADLPAADIIQAAQKLKIQLLVLSLVKNPMEQISNQALNSLLQEAATGKFALWLGGSGADYWVKQQTGMPKNCDIIKDIDNFHAKTKHLTLPIKS